MFDKLKYIELSGQKYPFKCDMLVLERIQEEYGDLGEFENKLSGFIPSVDEDGNTKRNKEGYILGTYGIPDIKTVNKVLFWMVSEGLEIESEEQNKEYRSVNEKTLIRQVDISPKELGRILQEEFARCFERKNEKTT